MAVEAQIVRSKRKTMVLQVKADGRVIVRAPMKMPERTIRAFLEEKEDWIHLQLTKFGIQQRKREEQRRNLLPLYPEEIARLKKEGRKVLAEKTAYFAASMGVSYGQISLRCQTTRWGSCSAKGNLNFNCLLMLTPEYVVDYVVIHELCHRREMNHSERFWKLVSTYCPEYPAARKWLRDNGGELIARMKLGQAEE